MNRVRYYSADGLFGPAINYLEVRNDGSMWVGNGEYETRVNFNPWTGEPAPTQMAVTKTGTLEYGEKLTFVSYETTT